MAVGQDERNLIVQTATFYYHRGWTQAQIAKKIGMSRPIVSRLLQKAKEEGIVEVFIKDEMVHTVTLEQQLENLFDLDEAVVAPTSHAQGYSLKSVVASAAASYVAKKTRNVNQLGISWGTTVAEFVKWFPYEKRPNLHIVPLEGGMGRGFIDIHANHLAYELAKKMQASCSYLYAPAIVDSEEMQRHFNRILDVKTVLQEGAQTEMAIIGVGNPHEDSTLEKVGYLTVEDATSLREAGAAGDVGFRFFDDAGVLVDHPFNERVVGVGFEQLKEIPTVIVIADGTHKLRSLKGILASGMINVLIIDEYSAAQLVK